MAAAEIIIEIDAVGNVQVEGKGFVGAECKTLTKDLEEALGDVTETKFKPEYRQTRAVGRKTTA